MTDSLTYWVNVLGTDSCQRLPLDLYTAQQRKKIHNHLSSCDCQWEHYYIEVSCIWQRLQMYHRKCITTIRRQLRYLVLMVWPGLQHDAAIPLLRSCDTDESSFQLMFCTHGDWEVLSCLLCCTFSRSLFPVLLSF